MRSPKKLVFHLIFWITVTLGIAQTQKSEADIAFERASKIYDYGRAHDDYYESRSALKTAERSFRNFLGAHGSHPMAQTAYYRMAVSQLLTGKTKQAELNFDLIISHYGRGQLVAASAYRMGTQRYNEKAYKKAGVYFKTAAKESEKPKLKQQALYQQARCLMLIGNKKEAVIPLQKLIAEPNNSYLDSGRLALAHLLFELYRYEDALEHFQVLTRALGVDAEVKAEALLYSGLSHARLGNESLAQELINQTLTSLGVKNEFKAQAQHELFKMYFEKGDLDSIISSYDKQVYRGEPLVTARSYLIAGYALLQKSEHQKAIRAFTSIERLVPNTSLSFEASYRRLYCFYQLDGTNIPDQVDAFSDIYGDYQKDSPWHHLAKVYKAETLYNTGQVEAAASAYRKIDSEDLPPGVQANFLYKKISCYAEAKDHAKVIRTAEYYLDQFSTHSLVYEVYALRGSSYLENGNYSFALDDFKRILNERPESSLNAISLKGMVTIYKKEKNYEELINTCQLLIEKFPGLKKSTRAYALYWSGWGYFKSEKFAEAIPPLAQARTLEPDLYNEPSGTRIFLSTYYLEDSAAMKEAYKRVSRDVPGKYFPPRILAWLGIQSFQQKDYYTAANILSTIATPITPADTPVDVWRYLTKSQLQVAQYSQALNTVEHVINREEDSFWKADALLDKSQAYLGLNRNNEAIATAEEALYYQPTGTIEAGIRFAMAEGKFRNGDLGAAKDEYLLVASKFEGDATVRPYALWKAVKVLEAQKSVLSSSMKNTLLQEYPDWTPPNED